MDHIGIDVHKRESQVCMRADGGELIEGAPTPRIPSCAGDPHGTRPLAERE